ncbi:hypothetical protein [Hirschia baltica]|nr:hypothetical protein [Hirschia baltica]
MKRTIIFIALLAVMLIIPFVMSERFSSADANVQVIDIENAPVIKTPQSAKKGQVWTLAGSNVTNGFFIVSKVERVNGVIVVHGYLDGLIRNVNTRKSVVADETYISLSLGAFNRSVVQLVGDTLPREASDDAYAAWSAAGADVSNQTIAEIANYRFS